MIKDYLITAIEKCGQSLESRTICKHVLAESFAGAENLFNENNPYSEILEIKLVGHAINGYVFRFDYDSISVM